MCVGCEKSLHIRTHVFSTNIKNFNLSEDFLNKFNEVIRFQQNLASAIEQQQILNEQRTTVSTLEAEENAEAKSWFNG